MLLSKILTFFSVFLLTLKNGLVKITKPAEVGRLIARLPRDLVAMVLVLIYATRAAFRKFTPW